MPEFPTKVLVTHKPPRQLTGFVVVPLLTLAPSFYTGQAAFAGDCTGSPISVCSGAASGADVPQAIDMASPISVTTQPGFGLSVNVVENGIDLRGEGGVSFVDDNQSNISTAGMFGLYVRNDTSGDLNITSTGSITGESLMGEGIRGDNYGANMLITANDTQGEGNGIGANGYGSGSVRVVSTGTATGLNNAGIYANLISGSDLTIEANNTQGRVHGIVAMTGAGALTVTSTGLATATNGDGITLYSQAGDITLTAADTNGGDGNGIYVHNVGTGAVRISSIGTATGSRSGIWVASSGAGDASITAKNTDGGLYGIFFRGTDAGNVSINSTASSRGAAMDGIYAGTGGLGSALNITVNDAQGGRNGVHAVIGSGTGPAGNTTAIKVLGHVAGGSGAAIATKSSSGDMSIVDLNPNATIESASGIAISNNGGDSHVIVREGAVVNGAIELGAGSDTVDLLAGFSGITVLDGGGGGVDTLNVSNAVGATRAGSDIRNWSVFNLGNSDLTLTDTGLTVGASSDVTTGVFLRNGSTLALQQNDFVLNGNLSLDADTAMFASTLGVGATTISGTVTNAGTITLGSGGAGSVLTIDGNYVGKDGVIALNTVLGNDASVTDKVVVKGDTAGASVLKVSNAGGAGAATTEGIVLVSVDGASNGAFSLSGDYQFNGKPAVVAGAYAYQLHKGNASGTETNNWYLRSELTDGSATAPDSTPAPKPLYQPGVSAYEAYPQALLTLNGVSTLQQRVGNRYWSGAGGGQGSDGSARADASQKGGFYTDGTGAWGRVEGGNRRVEPGTSTSGTDFTQNRTKMQAGWDALLSRRETGALVGGGYLQYVHGNTVTRSVHGDGDIATDGYGLGGTVTWYGNEGHYVDGQAQVMWFTSDLNSRAAGRSLVKGNDGTGYTLSVESGKRIALSPEWSLTPQAQLVYSGVHFDRFDDAFGATVRASRGASLQSRLGVTLDRETRGGENGMNRSHVYGIANLYYEFLDGSQVNVAGTTFNSRPDRLWAGVGAGVSYNWGKDTYSLYAEGMVNTSLAQVGSNHSLSGNMGFRMRW